MYFVDVNGLIEELEENGQDSSRDFKYTLAYILVLGLISLVDTLPSNSPPVTPSYSAEFATTLFSILLQAGLFYSLYQTNGGAKGKHFLSRFVPLLWVVGIRASLFVIPFSLLFVVFLGLAKLSDNQTLLASIVVGMTVIAYLYTKIRRAFAILREFDESNVHQP